jgi:predicted lipoprotein with Yx(FWY)xxD motif
MIPNLNRSLSLVAASIGAAIVTAACGGTSGYGGGTSGYGGYPATNPSGPSSGTPAASVGIANSKLGQILVDGSGRTLYFFSADNGPVSSCYGSCLQVWPALVTIGSPVAGPGVNTSLLTTTQRKDGTLEVVYNGHPLYYFSGDKQPGDVTGQALTSFGALWYVLSPGGEKIDAGSGY